MSDAVNRHDATGIIVNIPGVGVMDAWGTTVPSDGAAGYGTGCTFRKINGGDGTALYLNEGTNLSADFNAINPA